MYPARVRLTFLLPASLAKHPGASGPSPEGGCRITIDREAIVTIDGPSRERVQDFTGRYLRVVARDIISGAEPPISIAASLRTYRGPGAGRGAPARDSYQITIGADIAFAPTGLPVDIVDLTRDLVTA